MRLIAIMPDARQVGLLVDSLRNAGFDRKDMIISDLAGAGEQNKEDPAEVTDEMAFIKTEREGLWETGSFAAGVSGLDPGKSGIIVAVEVPKHESDRVRAIMEQSGSAQIIQD